MLRETYMANIHCADSGSTGNPAFRIEATGTGGGQIKVDNLDIYASRGVGLKIAQNTTAGAFAQFSFFKLRIEGKENNPYSAQGDLLQIGDPTYTASGVSNVYFHGLVLLSPYIGFCAMRLTAANAATKPALISVYDGVIATGSGAGKGLCLSAGRNNVLHFTQLTSADTNVTVGNSTLVGAGNLIDGNGSEGLWTWSVDPTTQQLYTTSYLIKTGDPLDGKMSLSANGFDGTPVGGNQRGQSTVDLQMSRTAATQVASGTATVIGGGANNTAAANATIAGGNTNSATGLYSAIPGGFQATDRGRYGNLVYASGQSAALGDAQLSAMVLRRTIGGTTPVPLTSNGSPLGTTNCMNIPDNTASSFLIRLHARDATTVGSDYDWFVPNATMTRDTGAASTVVTLGTPVTLTRGAVTGAVATAVADTTNGCLNVSFTPPTSNTHAWHAVARIEAVEVQ
jgi:hypothetical protein